MTRTVDLVIAGGGTAALAAATDALQRGRRVLIVLDGDVREWRRVRSCLCKAAKVGAAQVTVMTNAEVVCVDGIDGVEAVVVRDRRTGRLCAVNTPAFRPSDARTS